MTEAAQSATRVQCERYELCVPDRSRLRYRHANKADTYTITHAQDVWHDLKSSLLVSDRDGQPFASVALRLVSADGSYATYETESIPIRTHLDEVTQCIHQVERQAFDKPNPTAYLGL